MRPALALFLLACACTRSFIHDEEQVAMHRDLVYSEIDGRPLRLDLLLPRGRTDPAPLVLWMHGGSWLFGTHHDCRVDWLVEEGYAVASIAYRTSLETHWPGQLRDSQAAMRWLRAHGAEYGYRTDRIAAAGMSAGGHLALMLGLMRDEKGQGADADPATRVDAVISYYGPTDLERYGHSALMSWSILPVPMLLGASPRDDPERARAASPLFHIGEGSPPVLLIHGENDSIVPQSQSERFHERYREAGLSSEIILLADARHYGGNRYFGPEGPREAVLDFLRRTIGE